jgi:UDP-N-acetylmuramoyl-tripeptide--D-alanyl-D-alanine ligase
MWWRLEKRQQIVWTMKARAIWIGSTLIFWGIASVYWFLFGKAGMIIVPVLVIALPVIIGLSLIVILPIDTVMKRRKIGAAEKIILSSGVMVVGIAGSYGKTSTKEILVTMLERKFEVIKTPGNVNTDIGIANFVIENESVFKKEAVFVVEMGAYKKGEIETICKMIHPTHSILTGINESHLERFGSLENIITGKFELPQNTTTMSMLNFDDENIKKNYSRFAITKGVGISKQSAKNIIAKDRFEGLEFEWDGKKFETKLLGEHNITLILLCASIAKALSVSLEDIVAGVKNLQPVEHRLQPTYNPHTDIMVIDDSYNGNFNGIVSGIQVLSRASGRKIILTPGLVELGSEMESIHMKIAELYANNADLVLLIRSKMTECIEKGLKKHRFTQYKMYETTEEAHNDLRNVLGRGDTIIFQNDLTDNYF